MPRVGSGAEYGLSLGNTAHLEMCELYWFSFGNTLRTTYRLPTQHTGKNSTALLI